MSKLEAWSDVDQMERQDVASIVDDRNSAIKQYRTDQLNNMDGFEESGQTRGLRYIRTLKGRIDRRDRVYQPNRDEIQRSVEHLFIATVYSKDVAVDDVLELDDVRYTVTFVNKIGQSFTEAECQVIR